MTAWKQPKLLNGWKNYEPLPLKPGWQIIVRLPKGFRPKK